SCRLLDVGGRSLAVADLPVPHRGRHARSFDRWARLYSIASIHSWGTDAGGVRCFTSHALASSLVRKTASLRPVTQVMMRRNSLRMGFTPTTEPARTQGAVC